MSNQSEKKSDYEIVREMDAPLSTQLASFSEALGESNPEISGAYKRLVDTLKRGKAGAGAPKVGDPLPFFTLTDENGHLVTSDSLLDQGPLVISFNRGHWCPYCWLELGALNDRYDEINRLGARIISITPDTASFSKQLINKLGLRFAVLTDLDNAYAMELGLVIAISEEVKTLLQDVGLHLNVYQKNDAWFIPIPATFLVNRHGSIENAYINADFRERMDPAGLLDAIATLV